MCRVPTPIAARSKPDRGQIAPRSTRGQKPDGRSAGARRYRAIVAAFTAEIGGGDLSESDRALIKQAATLTLRGEQLAADVVAGKEINDDQLVRLSGQARRLLASISAKAADKKPAGQTLQEYMAAKARAAELQSEDEDHEND
jgi:hypothetical protein